MKTCPNCNVQLDDAATFCANCGARISESAQAQPQYTQNTAVPPQGDPYDHTAEFDPQDISDNKVFAIDVYKRQPPNTSARFCACGIDRELSVGVNVIESEIC